MVKKRSFEKDSRLLVEGEDDLHVLSHLLTYYNVAETFDIVDKKGIDGLLNGIETEVIREGGAELWAL